MNLFSHIPNGNAQVLLSLAIMLAAGFLVTRVTKKLHLPNVTGYLLAGIAIGPYLLHLIPDSIFGQMDFVTDLALAFIAFGVGRYFRLSDLRKGGLRILVITLFESLTAGIAISAVMRLLFGYSAAFSLLLGAIGCATAPASTIMTIRQYKAKGIFVNTILQVVALDDAVALLAFSGVAAWLNASDSASGALAMAVLMPVLFQLCGIAAGAAGGYLLHLIADPERRSAEHRLTLVLVLILSLTGFCTSLDISPLLACMMMGTVYINTGGSKKLFKMTARFTPPILLLFFVLSGMRLSLPALRSAGIVGVVYFLVRILGKYLGAWAGCAVTGAAAPVRRWLGLALIPQAGVSIGLAVLGQRLLPVESGALLSTIILSSGVLYEMIGPACAKASLFLSGTLHRPQSRTSRAGERKPRAARMPAAH